MSKPVYIFPLRPSRSFFKVLQKSLFLLNFSTLRFWLKIKFRQTETDLQIKTIQSSIFAIFLLSNCGYGDKNSDRGRRDRECAREPTPKMALASGERIHERSRTLMRERDRESLRPIYPIYMEKALKILHNVEIGGSTASSTNEF